MRRRLAWAGAFMLFAALVVWVMVAFPSPEPPKEARVSNVPADVVKAEKPRPFDPHERDVLGAARKFIATAVARRHVEDSWDLVAPSLKQGFTKKTWAKGDIPVVPYPVDVARWRVGYSFQNEIDLQVALFAKPKEKMRPVVFDMTLRRSRSSGRDRWLVSSFVPAAAVDGDSRSGLNRFNTWTAADREVDPGLAHSGTTWLLLPAGIFAMLLVVLAALGLRSWRAARIYRAYIRERQTSSSIPS
jgi:hypothetical protein